jgi:hypothetical protein
MRNAGIYPWKSREALIAQIATVEALARTAASTEESLHWDARRAELEQKAGALSESERAMVASILRQKILEYDS